MQTKNTIKQIILFFLGLFVAEGVLGFGLFWPMLFVIKDKKLVFWLAFFAGLFLSVIYSQKIGLMSIYVVAVLGVSLFFVGNFKSSLKWILFASLIANGGFELIFGLQWSLLEMFVLTLMCLWVSKSFESTESIKLNY